MFNTHTLQTYANTCMQCMQIVVSDLIPQVSHTLSNVNHTMFRVDAYFCLFLHKTQDCTIYIYIYCNLNKLHMVSN